MNCSVTESLPPMRSRYYIRLNKCYCVIIRITYFSKCPSFYNVVLVCFSHRGCTAQLLLGRYEYWLYDWYVCIHRVCGLQVYHRSLQWRLVLQLYHHVYGCTVALCIRRREPVLGTF